ncbi:MAG: SIR2 family protein [Melioribacteraceae bacterium]|nr:SIR2 family protein [Melioribacteraceae bacterium]
MSDSIKDELLEEINRNGVTIFCGAGISYQHPSNIPLSFDIKLQIIKSILSSGPNYLKTVYAKNRTEIEKKANSLLLEKLFQILFEFEGYRIRELFEIFNSSSPNQYHKIIAKLAEKGFVKNIITTNFDNLIELELDNHNIGYKKILNYSHLKNKRVSLIKLHGSIDQLNDEFDNFIITLKQVGKGLGAQKSKLLTNIFRKYSTLFVGWSDNDIDITPHLLSSGLKPFYWLHFSKSSKKKIFRKSKINNFHDKSIAYIIKNNNGSIIDCNPQTFLLEILNRLSIEITNDNNESVKSRKSFGSIINDWTLTISTRSRFLLLSELFRTLGKYKTAINLINYYKREFLDERNQFENAILLHDKAHSYQKKGDSLRAVKLYEASNTFCQGGINK